MAITINGSGTIGGVSVGGLPDGIVDSDVLASASVTSSKLASGVGGKVLQVVSALKTDTWSTTSSSFVGVTGLSLSITPSSTSSKIFLVFTGYASNSNAGTRFVFLMRRNGTGILRATGAGNRIDGSAGGSSAGTIASGEFQTLVVNGLDSPSTTSAITYNIDGAAIDGGTLYINRSPTDNDNGTFCRVVSTLTAMEIAG